MTVAAPLAIVASPRGQEETRKVAAAMQELRAEPSDLQRYLRLRALQRQVGTARSAVLDTCGCCPGCCP